MINVGEDCFAQIVINLVDNAIKMSKNSDKKVIALSSTGTDKLTAVQRQALDEKI